MTVNYDPMKVINEFRQKRQKVLIKSAEQCVNIAAEQIGKKDGQVHWDFGTSSNSKDHTKVNLNDETVTVYTGTDYDIYLERRYGIMARAYDLIKPYTKSYTEFIFGK